MSRVVLAHHVRLLILALAALLGLSIAAGRLGAQLTGGDAAGRFHVWALADGTAGLVAGGRCTVCHAPLGTAAEGPRSMQFGSGEPVPEGRPGPTSQVCISCHDGTATADVPVLAGGATPPQLPAYLVPAIREDGSHPIGRSLPWAGGYVDAGSIQARGVHLPDGRVECVSCHDPHAPDRRAMLRVDNAGSALCLTCHRK